MYQMAVPRPSTYLKSHSLNNLQRPAKQTANELDSTTLFCIAGAHSLLASFCILLLLLCCYCTVMAAILCSCYSYAAAATAATVHCNFRLLRHINKHLFCVLLPTHVNCRKNISYCASAPRRPLIHVELSWLSFQFTVSLINLNSRLQQKSCAPLHMHRFYLWPTPRKKEANFVWKE